jgi:dihydroorotate dehydrogenase electron transfer subunit
MTSPVHVRVPVWENVRLAHNTWRVRLHAPESARAFRPGQFLMLRLPQHSDPLLGRPFALYDTVLDERGDPVGVDVVYLVVGKVTGLMTQLRPGDAVEVCGPLGNGFPPLATDDHVALVAGGIGQTPFLAHVRDLLGTRGYGGGQPRRKAHRVSLFYGVRTAKLAAGVEDFVAAGAEINLATDDGSLGHPGPVTDLLVRRFGEDPRPPCHMVGCGPEPMLKALARVAAGLNVPCHLSLETPMACGLGICYSCVTKVKTSDGWDYKRVCVDGPVFDAATLLHD